MDSRKCQTLTASPAKPGDFPLLFNWQGALVQSILETGWFQFQGDAKADKYNLGGIGILLSDKNPSTGTFNKKHQDFKEIDRGVEALFQHLCVYASGKKLSVQPIADYTNENQESIAAEVQDFWEGEEEKGRGRREITFNDLKAPVPVGMRKKDALSNREDFVNTVVQHKSFVKQYGPPLNARNPAEPTDQELVAGWEQWLDRHEGTKGTTFTWAGGPFYAVKMMSLWAEAAEWVETHCDDPTVAREDSFVSPESETKSPEQCRAEAEFRSKSSTAVYQVCDESPAVGYGGGCANLQCVSENQLAEHLRNYPRYTRNEKRRECKPRCEKGWSNSGEPNSKACARCPEGFRFSEKYKCCI